MNSDNPNVEVVVHELQNEYNYGNPTGLFNLSLPHLEHKANNMMTTSYVAYRKMAATLERQVAKA